MRSQRACETMAARGHSDLTNLDGGFHGAPQLAQPGWTSMGYPATTEPHPGRTWEELRRTAATE